MNILPANMRFGAGQPVKRLEDQRLLTGTRAVHRRQAGGRRAVALCAALAACPRQDHVDRQSSAAKAMPGVVAIFTGADLIADDIGTIPTLPIFKRAGRLADDGAAAPPAGA